MERLKLFLATIGAGLVYVAVIGKFSLKTRLISAGVGTLLLLVPYLFARSRDETPQRGASFFKANLPRGFCRSCLPAWVIPLFPK